MAAERTQRNETLELTQQITDAARELGFTMVGVCPAVRAPGYDQFSDWLERGYQGQMHYLPNRSAAYEHPQSVLEGAKSVVMLALDYRTNQPRPTADTEGRIACYGWGADYHDEIHSRLKRLIRAVHEVRPQASARGVVDTAPLLERDYARLAGMGWIGKNTLLLNRDRGSWFFLAALLLDCELEYDVPFAADHCGTCRACLDACPTDAFPQPYVLDSRKCISYLTIELRDHIPRQFREDIGDWLFGCDVCQDVCPWNHRSETSEFEGFQPLIGNDPVDLCELFHLDEVAFRVRFRKSPLWRSKRRGILRNAAIVLGNKRSPASVTALLMGLSDAEPLVRAASAWALGRIADERAVQSLRENILQETDDTVRWESQFGLQHQQQRDQETGWVVADRLAKALDREDYLTARARLADDCQYEINQQLIAGADAIIESYRDNGAGAEDRFDSVSYESAVVCLSPTQALVHYRDILERDSRSHVFECRQWLTIDREQAVVKKIVHEELPGQRAALAEFEKSR